MSDYARQKFGEAVEVLASSNRPIQDRLVSAALSIIALKVDGLPEGLRPRFEALWHGLTKEKAGGDEGTLKATTQQLTADQAGELAREFLGIYEELLRG